MSSHSRPGGNGGVSRCALAEASGRSKARRGRRLPWRGPSRRGSRAPRAEGRRAAGSPPAAPMARVSRPRTSSPRRFSARRQASSRARESGVDRRPRLRRQAEQEELRRPLPAPHRRDCRVHARRVVLNSLADVWCGSLPLRCGSAPQSHGQESFVGPDRGRAEHLGQPSASGAPVDFHLPQPFPRRAGSRGGPRVIGIARVNVGHGLRVEEDLHGGGQPRQAKLPSEGRHGAAAAPASRPPRPTGAGPASERAGRSASDGGGWALHPSGQLGARKVHGRSGGGTGELVSPCRVGNGSSRIGCWREHVAPGLQLTQPGEPT